jgi:hypothetical protein
MYAVKLWMNLKKDPPILIFWNWNNSTLSLHHSHGIDVIHQQESQLENSNYYSLGPWAWPMSGLWRWREQLLLTIGWYPGPGWMIANGNSNPFSETNRIFHTTCLRRSRPEMNSWLSGWIGSRHSFLKLLYNVCFPSWGLKFWIVNTIHYMAWARTVLNYYFFTKLRKENAAREKKHNMQVEAAGKRPPSVRQARAELERCFKLNIYSS